MTNHNDDALRKKLEHFLKKYPKSSLEDLVRAAHEKRFRIDPNRRMRKAEIKAFQEGIISPHLAAFIRDMKIPDEKN